MVTIKKQLQQKLCKPPLGLKAINCIQKVNKTTLTFNSISK